MRRLREAVWGREMREACASEAVHRSWEAPTCRPQPLVWLMPMTDTKAMVELI
jgi:hypothetical protein